MGEVEVPADAYYGASTQRAVLNFPISGQPFPRRFIRALGMVKKAAAQTNLELGLLARRRARAIAAAAQEVIDGKLDDQFPIDIYQTGSGTSTNTNANEVIANRAIEILGAGRGSKAVHPNDHVNLCQSSNDVIPTAIQLSCAVAITDELIPALRRLQKALEAKSAEFWPVMKTGRTHLQDATPIRMGQVFLGFAGQGVVPLLTIDRYVGFVVLVALAFGVSFLFPIFLVFLELVGVLSPELLARNRRYSLLGISIFAAVITPSSDPYTMLAMMIPMYLFYEASIIIGRFLKRQPRTV